jgi:hypothetical protein
MTLKRVKLKTFNGVIECLPGTTFGDIYTTPPQKKTEPKGETCQQKAPPNSKPPESPSQ